MQLDFETRKVERSHAFEEKHFELGDLSLVMSILRSKLYSDPIKAICQEITSNARDAHREVGHPEIPIEVYLPTELSPRLVVKDYGPGISPERMTDIYLKYGSSSKRLDNTQTGGFGLGAKTPFAYGDSFTIDTITKDIDGTHTHRVYCAYLDETNIGKVTLLMEEKIDLPTGTEIQVPVQTKDFDAFSRGIVKTTTFWDVLPVLYPRELSLTSKDLVFTDRICLQKSEDSKFIILIDKIPYSFDWWDYNKLAELGYDSNQIKILEFYHKKNLIMNFETGELSVSANRERIEINDKNLKIIFDTYLNYDLKHVVPMISDLADIKTMSDVGVFFVNFEKKFPSWMRGRTKFDDFSWSGNTLQDSIDIPDICNYKIRSFDFSLHWGFNPDTSTFNFCKKLEDYTRSVYSFNIRPTAYNNFIIVDDGVSQKEKRLRAVLAQRVQELKAEIIEKYKLENKDAETEKPEIRIVGYLITPKEAKYRPLLIKDVKEVDNASSGDLLKIILMDPIFRCFKMSDVLLKAKKYSKNSTFNISDLDSFSRNINILTHNLSDLEMQGLKSGKLTPEELSKINLLGVFIGEEGGVYKDLSCQDKWTLSFKTYAKKIPTDLIQKEIKSIMSEGSECNIWGANLKYVVFRVNRAGGKLIAKENLPIISMFSFLEQKAEQFIKYKEVSGNSGFIFLTYINLKTRLINFELNSSTQSLLEIICQYDFNLPGCLKFLEPFKNTLKPAYFYSLQRSLGLFVEWRVNPISSISYSDAFLKELFRIDAIVGDFRYYSFNSKQEVVKFLEVLGYIEGKGSQKRESLVNQNY